MKRWYIAQTYSGYESSVKNDIERRIESLGMQEIVKQVLVPEEEIEVVKKDGSKKKKVQKVFPGYIFIEMEIDPEKGMDEDAWFMIRNTQKVTGFLGSSGGGTKPTPVAVDEMNQILRNLGLAEKPVLDIAVGDKVEVISGSFKEKIGEILSINEDKRIVTIGIDLFGSITPFELDFNDVKKIGYCEK